MGAPGLAPRCALTLFSVGGSPWPAAGFLPWSGQCPLSNNSGHCWILARNGLSANDPKRTLIAKEECLLYRLTLYAALPREEQRIVL